MADHPLYTYPQETWGAAKCLKFSRRTQRDGLGTPYPFKGYLPAPHPCATHGQPLRFNGGTVIDGEWYDSVMWPLPKVAEGFKWEYLCTWGYRLVKENAEPKPEAKRAKPHYIVTARVCLRPGEDEWRETLNRQNRLSLWQGAEPCPSMEFQTPERARQHADKMGLTAPIVYRMEEPVPPSISWIQTEVLAKDEDGNWKEIAA